MDLESRLQRLEALEAIRRLKHEHYCMTCDHALGTGNPDIMDKLLARFDDNIELNFTGFEPTKGIEPATQFYKQTVPSLLAWSQHRVGNPVIDLDGDAATGTWTIQALVVGKPGSPIGAGPGIIIGRYHESYARDESEWRWTRLACVFDVFAASEGGWADAQFND